MGNFITELQNYGTIEHNVDYIHPTDCGHDLVQHSVKYILNSYHYMEAREDISGNNHNNDYASYVVQEYKKFLHKQIYGDTIKNLQDILHLLSRRYHISAFNLCEDTVRYLQEI